VNRFKVHWTVTKYIVNTADIIQSNIIDLFDYVLCVVVITMCTLLHSDILI